MPRSDQPREFKFAYAVGQKVKRGGVARLQDDALWLDDEPLDYELIHNSVSRGSRLALSLDTEVELPKKLAEATSEDGVVVVVPTSIGARTLEIEIDRRCAIREAAAKRAALERDGQTHLIRVETCRVCQSEIDLSGLDETQYVYCRFCDSIFSLDGGPVLDGANFSICDKCGMFARIQRYSEFYFYFLVLVWGWRSKDRYLCDDCANGLFFKTLLVNLPFLLGVPNAIWIKIKSMKGRDPALKGIGRANRAARAGRYSESDPLFSAILDAWPEHPSILMNQALGHMIGGDISGARVHLLRALVSCNHYLPVRRLLG